MKNLFASILIFSILSFQFSELLVYVSFKINQDYIAKNLCIEKDTENSTCKGCCQLKKKVSEQQEQKNQFPQNQTEKQNINFCNHSFQYAIILNPHSKVLLLKPQKQYSFSYLHSIFHPPEPLI